MAKKCKGKMPGEMTWNNRKDDSKDYGRPAKRAKIEHVTTSGAHRKYTKAMGG